MNDRTNTRNDLAPRIYVASLSDYNAGRLHGRWIDADQPVDAIREEITAMLAESKEPPAEEWAIHDYENFGGLRLSEWEGLENVAEAARLIVEHGEVFAGLVDHFGGLSDLEEARRYMEEGYQGEFGSLADYAQSFVEECYSDAIEALPEFLRYHIDYDGIGRDMELGGDVFTVEHEHKVHVFWSSI